MALWIIFAVMTAAAALAILAPLARARRSVGAAQGHDVRVYRDQLTEVERDLDRGLIGPEEAEAARTEIARRLLKAAKADDRTAEAAPGRGRIAAGVAILVLPAIAVGVYLRLGEPGLPDRPLAARLAAPPDTQDFFELVARVEAHLAQEPEDGQGWEVLAPIYLRLQRNADAANAFHNSIRINGSTPARQYGLGQALTIQAGGVVTADARVAFEKAAAMAPTVIAPRLYLALALTQEGRHGDAAEAWRRIVAESKPEDPWLETARENLAAAEAALGGASAPASAAPPPSGAASSPAASGPSPGADDIAAAEKMAPDDRRKMIDGMVARLDERLKSGPGSVEDWTRLIRSLSVLGRTEDAKAAVARAREALAGNEADRARIEELSKGLGLSL